MCHHNTRRSREESSERERGDDERDDRREDRDDRREQSPVGEVVRTPVEAVRRAVAAVTP